VVHHVPTATVNAYTRFKLALTEDVPTIKTYEEAEWAELPEARSAPIGVSLALLDALHERWVLLLRVLAPTQFARSFRHPELGHHDDRPADCHVRLAWAASLGAHYIAEHADGLVTLSPSLR
jgi:hypothetical protein